MMLAISKSSFHFKYYLALHRIWGFYNTDTGSLCIYSQFIFWMTILTVIASPLIIAGWLILKTSRFLYKACCWTKPGRAFIDFLDRTFELAENITSASDKMIEAPAKHLIITAAATLGVSCLVLLVLAIAILGTGWFISIFMNIPEYIGGFFCWLLLGLFYILCAIGFVIWNAVYYVGFALKWIVLFIASIAGLMALIAGGFVLSALFIYILVKVALSIEAIGNFFGFKINGFQKARADAAIRREEIKRVKREAYLKMLEEKARREEELKRILRAKELGEIPYTFLEKLAIRFHNSCESFAKWFIEQTYERTAQVKGNSVKVIGVLGLIWETIVSLYHGVCPFVQFVEEEDLEEEE